MKILFILFGLLPTVLLSQAEAGYQPFKFTYGEALSHPTEEEMLAEVPRILTTQHTLSDSVRWIVRYWNDAYPSYRWHQLLMEASRRHEGHKNGGRVATLHLAIYDATVAAHAANWENLTNSPDPDNPTIDPEEGQDELPGRVCYWSAAAGAAHRVILHYFPEQRAWVDSQLVDFTAARLASGLQYPSDVERGLTVGESIGKQYVAHVRNDRTDRKWAGTVPTADSLWRGEPYPYGPTKKQWRPLTLTRGDQFRPAPPPTDWSDEMEELRRFNAENATSDIAWKWKSEPIWDQLLERKILEYDLSPLEAAFAGAVFHAARYDAVIAAWDGKYHYWGIRPFQYDPTFEPILVETPNFPGYPAGHTTVAGSLARVLSELFPPDAARFAELALECSESRFEGGVHFRTDNEVGLEVGDRVGQWVWKTFNGAR